MQYWQFCQLHNTLNVDFVSQFRALHGTWAIQERERGGGGEGVTVTSTEINPISKENIG